MQRRISCQCLLGVRSCVSIAIVLGMALFRQLGLAAGMPAKGSTVPPLGRTLVPEPVFGREPGLVERYRKTLALAFAHVLRQPGIPQSPYMDERFGPAVIADGNRSDNVTTSEPDTLIANSTSYPVHGGEQRFAVP